MTVANPNTIHVFGGGAVGGTFAALLARAGHCVVVIDSDAAHVEAINRQGLRIEGALDMTQRLPAATAIAPGVRPRYVIVAVKAQATRAVLAELSGRLAEGATIAFLQNGIGIYDADGLGKPEAVLGAITSMGAFRRGPGRVVFSGFGSLHVGTRRGVSPSRAAAFLSKALLRAHPSGEWSEEVEAHIWGKLALGAVYALSALRDADFVDLLDEPDFLAEASGLASEVAAVADACGVRPHPVDGWDVGALISGDVVARASSWASLRRAWEGHSQRRTGIWIDLAVKRRPSEVRALFEPVRERAGGRAATPRLTELLARFAGIETGLSLHERGASDQVSPDSAPPLHV